MLFDQETIQLLKQVIEKEGCLTLPANGNSMFPFIQKGDLCRFHFCDPLSLKKGDIALFHTSSVQLIAHRFYETKMSNGQDYYLFKGDTNLGFDQPVAKEQIMGKLSSIQKEWKKVQVEDLSAFLWGKTISSLPILSGLLQRYIR